MVARVRACVLACLRAYVGACLRACAHLNSQNYTETQRSMHYNIFSLQCKLYFFIPTQHRLQAWRVGFCICRACIHLVQSLNTSAVYGPTVPFWHLSSYRLQQLCATFYFIRHFVLRQEKITSLSWAHADRTRKFEIFFDLLIFLSFYFIYLVPYGKKTLFFLHVDTCGLWFYCFIRLVPNGKTNYILMKT